MFGCSRIRNCSGIVKIRAESYTRRTAYQNFQFPLKPLNHCSLKSKEQLEHSLPFKSKINRNSISMSITTKRKQVIKAFKGQRNGNCITEFHFDHNGQSYLTLCSAAPICDLATFTKHQALFYHLHQALIW